MKMKKMLLKNKKSLIFDGVNADLERKNAIELKVHMNFRNLIPISGVKSYVIQLWQRIK